MVTLLMKNEIIALHRQGKSDREISRKLGISRNTTNKYVKEANDLLKQIEKEWKLMKKIINGEQKNHFWERF